MFGELPKLFDRDFAVSYFVPSAVFVGLTYALFIKIGHFHAFFNLTMESIFKDATIFGLVSLIGGVVLLIINRGIIRFMEGYWPLGLDQRLNCFEKKRFRNLCHRLNQLNTEYNDYKSRNIAIPEELRLKRAMLMRKKAERFPDSERFILPTSFGNTYRAFEIYSRVMYGIDAIPGWYRLLAVIPKEYRQLVDSSRAQVDFWVNLWFLSLIFIFEIFHIIFYKFQSKQLDLHLGENIQFLWMVLGTMCFLWFTFFMATKAVSVWGNWIKSAFDVYLPELSTKLGLPKGTDKSEEKEVWTKFSRAVIYRNPSAMPIQIKNENLESTNYLSIVEIIEKLDNNQCLEVIKTCIKLIWQRLK